MKVSLLILALSLLIGVTYANNNGVNELVTIKAGSYVSYAELEANSFTVYNLRISVITEYNNKVHIVVNGYMNNNCPSDVSHNDKVVECQFSRPLQNSLHNLEVYNLNYHDSIIVNIQLAYTTNNNNNNNNNDLNNQILYMVLNYINENLYDILMVIFGIIIFIVCIGSGVYCILECIDKFCCKYCLSKCNKSNNNNSKHIEMDII